MKCFVEVHILQMPYSFLSAEDDDHMAWWVFGRPPKVKLGNGQSGNENKTELNCKRGWIVKGSCPVPL